MKKRSMLHFDTVKAFQKFYGQLEIYDQWKIRNGYMNDRGKMIQNKPYTRLLMDKFNSKNLFYKKVSIAEVTTWLDTFVHLDRIAQFLMTNLTKSEIEHLELFFEYTIEMSKMARVDVIFKFHRNLCLLEFSTVNNFGKIKSAYQKKRIELMIYKDLMQNYFPSDVKLIVYPFIGLYEFEGNKPQYKYVESNTKQAEYASNYIINFLIRNDYSPFD